MASLRPFIARVTHRPSLVSLKQPFEDGCSTARPNSNVVLKADPMKYATPATALVADPDGYTMEWVGTQYCSIIDPAL